MEQAEDQVEELRDDYKDWLQQSPGGNTELNVHFRTHQTSSAQFAAGTPVPRRAELLVQAMLPKVELKTLRGVYAEWASRWSIFSLLIYESTEQTDAQKLAILRLCLVNDTRFRQLILLFSVALVQVAPPAFRSCM